jgi:DNA polymerase-2
MIGVPNRYFGCYEDGKIKDRGIETRRHDTPPLFSRFQTEVLEILARGDSIEQVKALMPRVRETFDRYRHELKEHRVPLHDLIFTRMLSKDSRAFTAHTTQTDAIYQLLDAGKPMNAGQILQYVITDYYRRNNRKRSVPVELINSKTTYDARRYIELLAQCSNNVTEPFGFMILP